MSVYRYKNPQGGTHLAVLTKSGRKYLHLVMIDYPVRLKKVKKAEGRYLDPMPDEDIERTCEAMLDVGTRLGITKGAEQALQDTITATRGA